MLSIEMPPERPPWAAAAQQSKLALRGLSALCMAWTIALLTLLIWNSLQGAVMPLLLGCAGFAIAALVLWNSPRALRAPTKTLSRFLMATAGCAVTATAVAIWPLWLLAR